MAVRLPREVAFAYRQFSLYNSPYAAHDRGCAVDLYPETNVAPSPVAGEVIDARTVRAPPKPYSPEHDHLLLVDCGDRVARILHVDPAVEPGDSVGVGDPLGEMVRAGFFAPWVDNHLHLGFRPHDSNHYRASGSLPVEVDVRVEPLDWDGTGTVVERGETYVVLDAPAHPAPGERFVGAAAGGGWIDGGLPHYDHGGIVGGREGTVSLLGTPLGEVRGRHVTWDPMEVRANGVPVTGLSFFAARDSFGAKIVHPGHGFDVGDGIEVEIRTN